MVCKKCGKIVEDDSNFCLACGQSLEDNPDRIERPPVRRRRRKKKKNKKIPVIIILSIILAGILAAATYFILSPKDEAAVPTTAGVATEAPSPSAVPTATPSPTVTPTPSQEASAKPSQEASDKPTKTDKPTYAPKRGSHQPIPEDVRKSMTGISYTPNKHITLDDLAYLSIPHHNFKGETVTGNMVVDKDLADEVLDIFAELYAVGYPIENMELIDKYNDMQTEEFDSLDRSSMARNNTSSFCYRNVAGTTSLSDHALGRAIDVNPKTNPWVSSSGTVSPRNAKIYAKNRTTRKADMTGWSEGDKAAFIGLDTDVYKIFIKHGWKWGGVWNNRDYQHFYKP